MDKKKVVIIGGGIAGLTAGIYATISGFDAEIYEKNRTIGGECTGWDREGYHIDNCIHWMIGTTKGTELYKIWESTSAVENGVDIIHSDKMYTSELGGQKITLWSDSERTEQELIKLSPEDEVEIRNLMKCSRLSKNIEIPAKKPTELMSAFEMIKFLCSTRNALKLFKEFKGMDTNDLMNRFKHPLIRCMISDFCTKESLGYTFPMTYGNFISGDGGIPRGGSRAMALRMQEKFENLGGKVYTNSIVDKIELGENKKAKGIKNADGKEIIADYIVCACDTDYTFGHLLDKSYMPKMLKEMYENRKAYPVYGMFQVAFAVDSSEDLVGGDVILDIRDLKLDDWASDRLTVKSYSYEPDFAPEGKQIIQVMLGLSEESYDYWTELYKNKKEYNDKKHEMADMLMKKVEERFSGYSGKLKVLDIWTPVTYNRYCNAYKGYNQAFMITKHSARNPYPSAHIEGIDNVILAGQWINPPGGLPGAAITGKFAIQRILEKEKRKV